MKKIKRRLNEIKITFFLMELKAEILNNGKNEKAKKDTLNMIFFLRFLPRRGVG